MSELKVGMRVYFTQEVECYPHSIVRVGETGTITHIDLEEKRWHNVEVLLDTHHEGFEEWDNKLHMSDDKEYNDQWPSIYLNCIPI